MLCTHTLRQTDTHACTHPRFMAHQYEGAQESQAAPGLAPPQLPSLAVTFPSPSLHSFLFPGLLLFSCVSFSYSPSSLCWLSAICQPRPLCLSVTFSLSLGFSILLPPTPFPWTLHLSCLCCSSAQQFLGTSTATPEPQSDGKEKRGSA